MCVYRYCDILICEYYAEKEENIERQIRPALMLFEAFDFGQGRCSNLRLSDIGAGGIVKFCALEFQVLERLCLFALV